MFRSDLFKDLMDRAFRLAYFICLDRVAALRVAESALLKLEVAATAQVKRLYYSTASKSDITRSKIILSDKHLLQRLVYIELEQVEREKEEERAQVEEETVIVHFIKHLVRITMRRNSFYVALGINRLLHDYTTPEAMEIYNVVVQDPERVKDDYYYRSRKGLLIDELKKRFGDLIEITRGSRGEERFKSSDSSREYAELVEECLKVFTPWDTPCSVPDRFDPTAEEIPQLAHDGRKDINAVETNRMHAVIDPNCYRHIAEALKFAAPVNKLNVPQFILPKGGGNVNGRKKGDRRRTSKLTAAEVATLMESLKAEAARRKSSYSGLLSVAVDGLKRATIDLDCSNSAKLALSHEDELIEVRAQSDGDDLLLATYLVPPADSENDSRASRSEILIEGGQKIVFLFAPEARDGSATLEINYRQTKLTRAAAAFLRRAALKFGVADRRADGRLFPALKAAAAMTFILALASGGIWLALRNHSGRGHEVSSAQNGASDNAQPSPSITPAQLQPPTQAEANNNATPHGKESERVVSTLPAVPQSKRNGVESNNRPQRSSNSPIEQATIRHQQRAGNGSSQDISPSDTRPPVRDQRIDNSRPDDKATRDLTTPGALTKLADVHKIFVESLSAQPQLKQLEKLLSQNLATTSRLVVATSKAEADAVLKLSLWRSSSPAIDALRAKRRQVSIAVKLVNENGTVIWPTGKRTSTIYTGTLTGISQAVMTDLLKETNNPQP